MTNLFSVTSCLGLFMIHNLILRNLHSLATHAPSVTASNIDAFTRYADYTLWVLIDHFEAADTIWCSAFKDYSSDFGSFPAAHASLIEQATALKARLHPAGDTKPDLPLIARQFTDLHAALDTQYTAEEAASNALGHRVPIERIRELEKLQNERRVRATKIHGHLWSAVYLLRGLNANERAIFPPGLPKAVASGMLMGGAWQFRKELAFAPKF